MNQTQPEPQLHDAGTSFRALVVDDEQLFARAVARELGRRDVAADVACTAGEALERSAQLMPGNWETYDRLGYVYETQARYAESLQSYQRALELKQTAAIAESVERLQERIRRAEGS